MPDQDETTEDLIAETEEAKRAAEETLAEAHDDAEQLQEELDRRAAEQDGGA